MGSSVRNTLKKKQIIDEIDTLNQVAYNTRNTHAERSMSLAKKNLQSAEKNNYAEGIAFSMHVIGLINLDSGNFKTAAEMSRKALEIFTRLNDEEGMSSTLNTIGITLRNIGSYERALDFLMKSLDIQIRLNNTSNIAKLYCNIGNIYGNLDRHVEGLPYYLKCLEIVQKLKDEEGTADAFSNLGICYQHLGKNSKSIKSHESALKIRKSLDDKKGIAFCLNNLGKIYEEKGKYQQALNYYLESLDIKLKLRMKLETARICNNIGHLHIAMEDYETAEQYLEKGARLLKGEKSSTTLSENHRYFSMLYIATGDYKKALKHHMAFHQLDKEIFDSNRIAGMEAQLDLINSELYFTNKKLEDANVKLNELSITDSLTGIFNRRRFEEFLATEWCRCQRTSNPISLLMIDLDFFKPYNDTYGHTLGDDCLRAIAYILRKKAHRPTDIAARYGGEEFAIILSETDAAGAMKVAESVRTSVEAMNIPHDSSDASNVVTISIGTATLHPDIHTEQSLLVKRADKALYTSKKEGRNRITQFEENSSA